MPETSVVDASPAVQTPAFTPTQLIPINKIKPSAHQARKGFDPLEIKALADCLAHEGLINPITVNKPSPGLRPPSPRGRGIF